LFDMAWGGNVMTFQILDEDDFAVQKYWKFDTNGTMFFNDSANANMTIGLTINQGANDDQILAFKSSDVAHGATAQAETDTFFDIQKSTSAEGGTLFRSLHEDTATATTFRTLAAGGTASTTKSSAGRALHETYIYEISGTSYADITANGNVWSVRAQVSSATRTLFLVDEDGDYHYDGADGGAFDSYDDANLTRAMAVATGGRDIIRDEWDKYVDYNEADLVKAGVLGDTVANGGLVNGAAMQRLHTGAIWQLNTKHMSLVEEVASLRGDLAIANSKLNALGA